MTRQHGKKDDVARSGGTGPVVADIADEILRSFELLKALAALGVAQRGLTMSLRAILQDLHENGARTVPQIAAGRTMTRQSIQASVDQLRAMDLVEIRANPAHQRSPIIALSAAGQETWQAIRQREKAALGSLAGPLAALPLEDTRETLQALRRALEARLAERRREANA